MSPYIYLSVIIPAKNEESLIKTCLTALTISLQKLGEGITTEIILVDNSSTDSTREIAERFNCQIIIETQGNISRLRNIGARNAQGDFFAFLDADCFVDPLWASNCLKRFADKNIAVVGTRAIPDLNHATWVEEGVFTLFCGSEKREDFVRWLGTSNLFVRKEFFEKVNGFNEKLVTAEDVNFCQCIRKKGGRVFLEKSIDTKHLRESKTLKEFYIRERWRGRSSMASFITNNFPSDELLSVVVPLINLFSIIIFSVLIFFLPLDGKYFYWGKHNVTSGSYK